MVRRENPLRHRIRSSGKRLERFGRSILDLRLRIQLLQPDPVTSDDAEIDLLECRRRSAGLAQCAAGNFNSHWVTLANNLLKRNLSDTIMRPGWEMNGDWFDWSAGGHEASYIGCFRQIVNSMRSVSGQDFTFVWNPSIGTSNSLADKAYPGDSYVDYVGIDTYDWVWRADTYDTKATQKRRPAARCRESWLGHQAQR